jgi:parallel beta-helix repeat protein
MKRLALLILLTGLLAAVSAGRAMAAPPTPVTCGSVITAPGQYVLAGDCTGAGITITASDVHLKLDGHTMTSVSSFFDGLVAGNVSHVHIQGPGTIRFYRSGIVFGGVSDSHVEQVTSVNNQNDGFVLFNVANIHVNNSVFSMNGRGGLVFSENSTDNHVDNNQTLSNGFIGIQLVTGSTSNHVNGNTALGNGVNDLEDDNPNCDNNKWNGNRFNTASQPCIH